MRKTIISAAVLFALAGCGATDVNNGSVSDAPPTVAATTADTAEPTPGFGQTFTTDDENLSVTVAAPEPFKASGQAAGNDKDRGVLITTTVQNNSDKPYDFNPLIMGPKVVHNGQQASEITDIGNKNLALTNAQQILPGRKLTYKTAFSIGKDPAELQVTFTDGIVGDPIIFVGQY